MSNFAWVTLATNDSYSLGALVLAYSLKRVSTTHQLTVLITPGVSNAMREKLGSVFDVVREVNVLDSQDSANLALLARPELGITFTKLNCWTLVQFEKCVFLDADTLVLQNCDELFEREELSAAPDVGWPDCFNSGVFVFRPSLDTYDQLVKFAVSKGSFDGGDQGLLNLFFSDWAHKDISKHLPFIYNTCSTACYSYLPAFKQFGDNVKILHFIGNNKPWLQNFDSKTGKVHTQKEMEHIAKYLQYWWAIFFEQVHSNLSSEMAGIAGALANVTLGEYKSAQQEAFEHHMRRQCWESGNIDYMGKDSFDNIWRRISKTMETSADPEPAAVAPVAAAAPAPASTEEAAPQKPSSESKPQTAPSKAKVDESVEEETVKIQERVTTSKTPDGKTILTKVTTLPGRETEEIEEETIETIDGETKTNKTKSEVVKAPFPVSKVGNKEIAIKNTLVVGKEHKEFDAETNTTIITKRTEKGYEQTFTTVLPDGRTKTQTKTFFDPVDIPGDEEEEEEIEEYEEIKTTVPKKTTTTTNTNKATNDETKAVTQVAVKDTKSNETKKVEETKKTVVKQEQTKKTVEEVKKTVVKQEETKKSVEQKKIEEVKKTVVKQEAPKKPTEEKTVVKQIPSGKQEITTSVTPEGKTQTKTRTIYDPEEEEEIEEYEETRTFDGAPKKSTTTTTTTPVVKPKAPPAKQNPVTTVAVPNSKKPNDNVLARKVVTKGEEEIEITEEKTETQFSGSKKTTITTNILPGNPNVKLDPKGKTTVTTVIIPGSQDKQVSKSDNKTNDKQLVTKTNPSGTQEITKSTTADGKTKVQVKTTMNPEEMEIEETETTNIIGDKKITTTRTEVPLPGKKIVKTIPPTKTESKGPKTTTTTTTTTQPVGVDRVTVTKKNVDKGVETTTKTETKDGKTKIETRTQFEPIFHPAVSDDEEIEEYEEETTTHAPIKTKTTTTTRVPAGAGNAKPKVTPAQPENNAAAKKKVTPSATSSKDTKAADPKNVQKEAIKKPLKTDSKK